RDGIIAGRGRRSDHRAVVIISIRVVVIGGAAVIAVGRPDADACAYRDTRPEAAATVAMMMAIAAALVDAALIGAAREATSADAGLNNATAGYGARPEAAITAGCDGRAASSEASAAAAGCNGHAATSKAAGTAWCN